MKWILCHRPKRYWLCYSAVFFLFSGLGLLFPSSLASAYDGNFDPFYSVCIEGDSNCQSVTGLSSDFILYRNSNVTSFRYYYPSTVSYSAGAPVLFTGSIWASYWYEEPGDGNTKNKSMTFNCPTITDIWFNQTGCEMDSYVDTAGSRHNVVFNYVISGTANTSATATYTNFRTLIVNQSSTRDFTVKILPPTVATGYASTSSDYSGLLNAIRGEQQAILSKLNSLDTSSIATALANVNSATLATNSKLDEQTDLMSQQLEAQQQANDQQQEQYESEKQEESDREDEQSDSADEMAGLFNFSLSNPFAPMFALFNTGSTCVSIPTLANWLHLEQNQVCSFFPSKVISVVTPVLAISSVMLLFGFFVRWLNGRGGDGGITVKGGFNG